MTITVKNGFCKKLFLDETGKRLAVLRSQKLFGPEKVIADPGRTVKYETDIEHLPEKPAGENRQYTIKQGGALVATALPVYAPGADHFAIPMPPRPIGLSIQIRDGTEWRAARDDKNSVMIHTPDGIGRLSDYFSMRPQVFEIPDKGDVFLWVAVYSLVGYMMHEDDVLVV